MNNIVIVTSGHPPLDERIFYKFACSLKKHKYNVTIICSNLEINDEKNGIVLSGFDGNVLTKSAKINRLKEYISLCEPDVIICCEPLTIISAYKYKKTCSRTVSVISDITEWYPENVALKLRGLKRIMTYIQLFLFNIYSSNLADSLIVGEPGKKKRYDIIAPFKKKIILGYYPVLEFFHSIPKTHNSDFITLGYAGVLSFERGILTLLETADLVAKKHPEKNFRLKIAGRFQYKHEEEIFQKKASDLRHLKIELCDWVEYPNLGGLISDMDICFDLRKKTFIYRNSLPIKIFEYMASAKPVIYSDIRPIRQELPVKKFGFLIDPEDKNEIISKIENYLDNRTLLEEHGAAARKMSEEKYNWNTLEPVLIKFIEQHLENQLPS